MVRRPVPWERALVVLADYPATVYFRDRWARWWRVYDAEPGRKPQCPPLPSAAHRYFVSTEGQRFRYTFEPGDDRALSARLFTRQRERAELVRVPTKRRT